MTSKRTPGSVDSFIDALDEEHEQEEKVREHRDSFFATAPDAETLVTRAREFDDVEKHLVRREYWLAAAKAVYNDKGAGLRLLTLPGRHRLEIEHYRSHGLLEVSANAATNEEELGVVGFETAPEVFALLRTTNPRFSHLFQADLIKTLAEPSSPYHKQLVRLFPFDVVNLDLTANLVSPKDGPYGPVLKAIRECLRLQVAQAGQWALMLTFRIGQGDTDQSAIEELTRQFQDNISEHSQFKHACFERHGLVDARRIYEKSPDEALGQFAAKWITDQAHVHDWQLLDLRQAHYWREFFKEGKKSGYYIKKLVFRFRRGAAPKYAMPSKQLALLPWHIDDLVLVAKSSSVDVDAKVRSLGTKQSSYLQVLRGELEALKRAANSVALLQSQPQENGERE